MKVSIYYYRKNGVYCRPLVTSLSFYFWALLALVVALYFLLKLPFFAYLEELFIFSIVALLSYSCFLVFFTVKRCRENGGFFNFLYAESLEEGIKYALVRQKNITRLKDVEYLQVPWVYATMLDNRIKIEVARIAGMVEEDQDKLAQLIDTQLEGKYKNFAVSLQLLSDDKLRYIFYAEDVASNLTWVPSSIAELQGSPYRIKLQKDLTINLAKNPGGIGIFGTTGSGKSTVIFSIIAQTIANSDLLLFDGKQEYRALNEFYPKQLIYNSADEMEQALKIILEKEIPYREKLLQRETKKQRKLGLTGADIGMRPLILIADEVTNIAGTKKQLKEIGDLLTKILKIGRSLSCYVLWASQDASVSGRSSILGQDAMSQFSTKILLGNAKPEVQREVFSDVVTDSFIPKYRGFYTVAGKTYAPQKFFVPNLVKYDLENLNTFEKLYKGVMNSNERIKNLVNKKES